MIKSHTFTAKFIHWTFSGLYAYGIFKQVGDLSELEDTNLLNFEIVFAILFLVLVMVRFFYMRNTETLLGATEEVHKGHLFIAKTIHRLVYFSLVMLPLTGLLIAGIFTSDIPGMGIAISLHEFSASLSYVLLALHIGASIYSRLKGEGVWTAMVPVWKETGKPNSEVLTSLESIENKVYDEIESRLNL